MGKNGKLINYSKLAVAFTNRDLCTRSGTCVGICPENAIEIGPDFYPNLAPDRCTQCGLCGLTCPGSKVNYGKLTQITFNKTEDPGSFDGYVEKTFVGYATDRVIRERGAGGGVITAMLWDLIQRREVDGAIVTRMDEQKPWLGKVFVARTYEDLLASQQSKYTIIPVNSIFKEVKKLSGRFAIAALPCQIHGLRMATHIDKKLASKIYVVIGLFCASSLHPNVALEMMQANDINPELIKDFQFRGGKWPGKIRAIRKDGRIVNTHYSNFKDGAINYLTFLYSPFRCQTCIDGSAEFSDISVSDAWTRDENGNYLFESQSKLLVRTPLGAKVMQEAIGSGALVANDVTQSKAYQTHKLHQQNKGINAPIRVDRLKRRGLPVPEYDRPMPPVTTKLRRNERIATFIMALGKKRALRYPLFKFLISRYGAFFVIIRQKIKARKYRGKKSTA